MKHKFFEITNFKGIEHIRIDFDKKPAGNVYTLVGLNESGKTTILEALHFFEERTLKVDAFGLHGYSITDLRQLIPVSKISNFNESISIRVGYSIEPPDKVRIAEFMLDNHGIEIEGLPDEFTVSKIFEFENSIVKNARPASQFSINPKGKTKRGKHFKNLERDKWDELIDFVKKLMPNVLYFPNFLFEFPDRIYLENPPDQPEKHQVYRDVFEDILHAIDRKANLEKHVIERIKNGEGGWSDWLNESLDSVLSKMAGHVSRTVFEQWNKILNRETVAREIVIRPFSDSFDEDGEKKYRIYLQVRLKEGTENYSISQRSLGFRWFFAFLLFTQYRGFRGGDHRKNVLFLFDEPASNLHSSAQEQLLSSFGKFPENSSLIYTTHSHHLINPAWLENAYVVKNEGLSYEDWEDSFQAANTRITLQRYREFVASHPDQTTYFKPILDVLDYSPSKLENIPNIVMFEGKNDFYTVKYVVETVIANEAGFHMMPGGGAGSLDSIIQLYIAWGREFIVILDSDQAGKEQKKRYENKFGIIVENRLFQLSDIDSKWTGSTENLFTDAEKKRVQASAYPEATEFNKTHFNRALQEAFLTSKTIQLSKGTTAKFQKISDFAKQRLMR